MGVALEKDFIKDMLDTHTRLTIDIIKRDLDEGIRPDGIYMVQNTVILYENIYSN